MERLTSHFDYCEMFSCKYHDKNLAAENKCLCFDKSRERCHERKMYEKLREYEDVEETIDVATSALRELQMYKDDGLCLIPSKVYEKQCGELDDYKVVGTLEEVRVAVEKQKSKKPHWHVNPLYEKGKLPICPTCNTIMVRTEIFGRTIDEHCVTCGQAIDWSESEC